MQITGKGSIFIFTHDSPKKISCITATASRQLWKTHNVDYDDEMIMNLRKDFEGGRLGLFENTVRTFYFIWRSCFHFAIRLKSVAF
jgi:hypothetical protein